MNYCFFIRSHYFELVNYDKTACENHVWRDAHHSDLILLSKRYIFATWTEQEMYVGPFLSVIIFFPCQGNWKNNSFSGDGIHSGTLLWDQQPEIQTKIEISQQKFKTQKQPNSDPNKNSVLLHSQSKSWLLKFSFRSSRSRIIQVKPPTKHAANAYILCIRKNPHTLSTKKINLDGPNKQMNECGTC